MSEALPDNPEESPRMHAQHSSHYSSHIPVSIPQGVRVVVRTAAGIDEHTGRQTYRDVLGHVIDDTGQELVLRRDPAANGSRPAMIVRIARESITHIKPIPERTLGCT